MEFTEEEIKLVEAHRAKLAGAAEKEQKKLADAERKAAELAAAKKAKEDAAQEAARRQQSILASIAKLIEEAKVCLQDAKRIAGDNGFQYSIEGMVTEMINEVSDGQYWYGSDQSHC